MDAQPVQPTPPIRHPTPIAQVVVVLLDNGQCAVNFNKDLPLKLHLSMMNAAERIFVDGMPDEKPKIIHADFVPKFAPVSGNGKR